MSEVLAEAYGDEVDCVLIPLHEDTLLLPNACVVEIMPWRRLKPNVDTPSWHLGTLAWRGIQIQVVSLDGLLRFGEEPLPPNRPTACLLVMNRVEAREGLEFYGIAAQGLPRLLKVSCEDVVAVRRDGAMARARLGTEEVLVPDLDQVEEEVSALVFA